MDFKMQNIILSSTCALYNTSREDNRENLMVPRDENTVVVQGLHVKFHEAFTGKTNTSNVYTDIQLAKVKVG